MAEAETAPDPRAVLYDAVRYVLARIQTDPDLRYIAGEFTETFDRMCRAEAAHLGESVATVQSRRRRDAQPEYRRREARVVELRDELAALRSRLEAVAYEHKLCSECAPIVQAALEAPGAEGTDG